MSSDTSERLIFFAYKGKKQDSNDDNVEAIKRAITEFNKYQSKYRAISWEEYRKSTPINVDVREAIDECEIFVCDLTYFNHNVLYELGYALGKNKTILVLLNPDVNNAADTYKNFFLKAIRYSEFRNAPDIQSALKEGNYKHNLLGSLIETANYQKESTDLLYIKSKLNNQPSLDLSEKISFLKSNHEFSLIVDDPVEVAYRPVGWYLGNIYRAKFVVIHFWGEEKPDSYLENAQNSFFAGLACGLGSQVLLVAPAKYRPPLDYYDILFRS